MSNAQLKILGALLMVIDHAGAVFLPEALWPRVMGRFCMPIFAMLMLQGERRTSSFLKYVLRLAVFAVMSQPIFMVLFHARMGNILFSLCLGVCFLRIWRLFPPIGLVTWPLAALAAYETHIEYGFYGQILFLLLAIQKDTERVRWWIYWLLLHLALAAFSPEAGAEQLPAILSPFVLKLSNGVQGAKMRWFYLFYPVHLIILLLLKLWLSGAFSQVT